MKLTTAFRKIAKMRHINKVIQGSQGASKTYSVLQRWILVASQSKIKQHCTIVTGTFDSLRSGAIKDFETICVNEDIPYYGTKNPTILHVNKWTFEFFSVDKENKGLGARRDRLFINEAIRIPWKIARQLIARTHVERIFDFNPSHSFWVHEQYVDTKDCDFLKLTYKDNEALPQSEIKSIERHAPWGIVPDPNYWRVYGKGEIGFIEGAILQYKTFDTLPTGVRLQHMIGVDFGWNDPLTGTMVHIDRKNKRLYWREMFYASKASHDDFARVIKADPQYKGCNLICDASAPREIMELRKRGLPALGSDKKGGLASDIRRLKQYELYIHKDSKNLIRESDNYKWQEKKGVFIEYPDQSCEEHAIDGARGASIILMNF